MQRFRAKMTAWLTAVAIVLWLPAGAAAANLTEVVPIGRTAGIRIDTDGLLVESVDTVMTAMGEISPAKEAGFRPGDILVTAGGDKLENSETLQKKVALSGGQPMQFEVERDGKTRTLTGAAVQDKNGVYRLGVTVRDSVAGIGTITYVDPTTGQYGSLGHGICDGETGVLVPLEEGSLMEASVSGVVKGVSGTPGSLQGDFNLQSDMGTVEENTLTGIFGVLTDNSYYAGKKTVPVAQAGEIKTGKAAIMSNVEGETVREYACEITKIYGQGGEYDRCMTIQITDPALIECTGGIVQGMSGSPILQNGKLVGAVTHVLVNDPTRGYAVQIEKMLEAAG
ncbi:MAG: SpoIVB peptidase [Butyricicoccus sp.]